MTSWLRAGIYSAQIAILDSNGYPMGTLVTPNAPVANTVYSPYTIPALIEYAPAQATYESAYSYAGMKLRGRRALGATDYGIGTLTLAEYDDTFDALVMGWTNDTTTATSTRINAKNSGRVQQRNFMLALTTGATPSNSAVNYETRVLLNCYFTPAAAPINQSGGQNPTNLTYNIYVNVGLRAPWGQLLSAATVAPDGDSDTEMGFYYSAPYLFCTYVDNGSTGSFSLPYTPSSTEHAGAINIFYKNGTEDKSAITGISGTTVTRTASSSGDIVVVWFPSTGTL